MIITRTPYRISMFGGGTDYPWWYEKNGGLVLSTTIDKYCYVLLRRMPTFLGSRYRIFWSKIETTDNRSDIEHNGVRGCLEFLNMDDCLEINHAGDLPARSGLGSSSAFTVGMLNALHTLRCENTPRHILADEAIKVEQEVLKETVGIQDQIACAWGGFNVTEISTDGSYKISAIKLSGYLVRQLENHLMLFFSGTRGDASKIAEDWKRQAPKRQDEMEELSALTSLAIDHIKHARLDDFGALLDETWKLKKRMATTISNPSIDSYYEKAIRAGALGGKILGAGGGGFMLFYVPPEKQLAVHDALDDLLGIPVKFEYQGSQVILK